MNATLIERRYSSISLKVLHRFFVFLGCGLSFERAEIPAFPGLRIFLSRIQTITGFNFSNHALVMSTEVETSLDVSDLNNAQK
jgi:hypothetical protein